VGSAAPQAIKKPANAKQTPSSRFTIYTSHKDIEVILVRVLMTYSRDGRHLCRHVLEFEN